MRHVQRGISVIFIVIFTLAITVAATSAYFILSNNLNQKAKSVNSFEECAKLYPVMESYPEQCNTPDGKHFTRELSAEEKEKIKPVIAASPASDSAKSCMYFKSPKIDSHIIQFINSDNPEQFADTYDIDFKDNKIRVDIETLEGKDWSGNDLIEVETTSGRLVEGLVSIDNLCKVAEMPEVTFIKIPGSPIPL